MKLGRCSRCERVWLECRELDWVAAQEKGFLSCLERGVLVGVCDQCLGIRLDGGKLEKMSTWLEELERDANDRDQSWVEERRPSWSRQPQDYRANPK
ncbi:MAG: hypothetical protein HYY53_00805 [candidate division NC10 bacterium]|nr:hypothetical protein [candidate division NC10 bacterium]